MNNYFSADKKKYISRGVNEKIPLKYQMFMFKAVEELRDTGFDMDYLNVFEFRVKETEGSLSQMIEHRQEVPSYMKKYTFPVSGNGINEKLFMIDDESHVTLLLADEY